MVVSGLFMFGLEFKDGVSSFGSPVYLLVKFWNDFLFSQKFKDGISWLAQLSIEGERDLQENADSEFANVFRMIGRE